MVDSLQPPRKQQQQLQQAAAAAAAGIAGGMVLPRSPWAGTADMLTTLPAGLLAGTTVGAGIGLRELMANPGAPYTPLRQPSTGSDLAAAFCKEHDIKQLSSLVP